MGISELSPSQALRQCRQCNNPSVYLNVKGETRIPTKYQSTNYPFWWFGFLCGAAAMAGQPGGRASPAAPRRTARPRPWGVVVPFGAGRAGRSRAPGVGSWGSWGRLSGSSWSNLGAILGSSLDPLGLISGPRRTSPDPLRLTKHIVELDPAVRHELSKTDREP